MRARGWQSEEVRETCLNPNYTNPAVLKVKIKTKIRNTPRIGPKKRLLKDNDSPDPPSGPPGEGGQRKNKKRP